MACRLTPDSDHARRNHMAFQRGWLLGSLGLDGDDVAAAVAEQRAAAASAQAAAGGA